MRVSVESTGSCTLRLRTLIIHRVAQKSKKGKGSLQLLMEFHLTATEWDVTCQLAMGSHSVTFHPTQVNTHSLGPSQRPVLDLPTPEGWKTELT